jgi:hypothetical protein
MAWEVTGDDGTFRGLISVCGNVLEVILLGGRFRT